MSEILDIAHRQRAEASKYRRTRKARLKIALALVDAGRLHEWDERDLGAIDDAMLQLALDWAASVSSDGVDPVPRSETHCNAT